MDSVILRELRAAEEGARLVAAVAGDACPRGGGAAPVAEGKTAEILAAVRPYLDGADLRLVQWETPLTDADTPIAKSGPNIRCAPSGVNFLRDGGFDVALLANNHIGDFGPDPVNETVRRIAGAGIRTVGAGANLEEACRPLRIERNGLTLSIINAAEHEFGTATETDAGAAPLEIPELLITIMREKAECGLVLVVTHGGNEYCPVPSPRMVRNARAFAEAGASAVVNIHPHCPQGVEVWNGVPIVYSTGDFFFPRLDGRKFSSRDLWYFGYLPRFSFDRRGCFRFELLPYFFADGPWRVEPLDRRAGARFAAYLDEISGLIADRTACFESWAARHALRQLQTAAAALVRLPFDMSDPEQRGKVLSLRNTFTCEAHKEVVDTCLRLAETGRLDEAAAGYARLEALQEPDFFGDRDAD